MLSQDEIPGSCGLNKCRHSSSQGRPDLPRSRRTSSACSYRAFHAGHPPREDSRPPVMLARAQAPGPSSPVRSTSCQPLVHLKGVALDLIGQQHSVVAHGQDRDAGHLDGAAVRLCAESSVVCASDPPGRGDPRPVTVLERVDYLELQVPDGRAEVLGPLLECLATFDPAAAGNDDEVIDDARTSS